MCSKPDVVGRIVHRNTGPYTTVYNRFDRWCNSVGLLALIHGESRGRVRTWCGKQRLKAGLPARWPRSRIGAGPTGTGLHSSSAPGCLQHSTVTAPTTASRGTFGGYRNIATKSCGCGTSGWNVERAAYPSHGTASTHSSPVTRCQRPGSFTATPEGNESHTRGTGCLMWRRWICGVQRRKWLPRPRNDS
jgi:hypothetical protein